MVRLRAVSDWDHPVERVTVRWIERVSANGPRISPLVYCSWILPIGLYYALQVCLKCIRIFLFSSMFRRFFFMKSMIHTLRPGDEVIYIHSIDFSQNNIFGIPAARETLFSQHDFLWIVMKFYYLTRSIIWIILIV